MNTAVGYAIYLMTDGELQKTLKETIKKISREYLTPFFEPHITLMPDIIEEEEQILDKTLHLSRSIEPFTIILEGFGYFEKYFQSLFLYAQKSDELINANLMSREVFDRKSDPDYMPHLSLIYGNISEKAKKSIISSLEFDNSLKFEVKSLDVFSSKGRVENWFRVNSFPL